MPLNRSDLRFCWWNLHNFAHFDPSRVSSPRWPKSAQAFESKLDRIAACLPQLIGGDVPDLLGLCEITREAARSLTDRFPGVYEAVFAPAYPRDDGFQVVILHRKGTGFVADPPLLSYEDLDVPEETRPMISVRYVQGGLVIRFVACHWTSFDTPQARASRIRLADYLRGDVYQYLYEGRSGSGSTRHCVVMGDLNEEPASAVLEQHLTTSRDHGSCRKSPHSRDRHSRRVRLYNASWRFLGEQIPYTGTGSEIGPAGTYYGKTLGWRTFDHLIVSGNLLESPPPYLSESGCRIVMTSAMHPPGLPPRAFESETQPGISDHLPIVGRIVLPESPE